MANLTIMDGFRFALGGVGAGLLVTVAVAAIVLLFSTLFLGDE